MSNRILSRDKFVAWLNTKHPRTKAGISCEVNACPLAKFLTQTTGNQYEVDGYDYVQLDSDGSEIESTRCELPNWAAEFVSAVDDNEHGSVSVMRALTIVENSNIGRGRVSHF
jgi:hypothetical protein